VISSKTCATRLAASDRDRPAPRRTASYNNTIEVAQNAVQFSRTLYKADNQRDQTTEAGGPRGYDAGKKINGRKRHALVDTDGRGLVLEPRPASIQDRDGGGPLLRVSRRSFPFIQRVFADGGYAGEKVTTATLIAVEIVRKMRAVANQFGVDLRTAALQFSAAPDVAVSLIVGAHTEAQALANASSMKVTIPQGFWAELKRQNLIEQSAPVPEGGALPQGRAPSPATAKSPADLHDQVQSRVYTLLAPSLTSGDVRLGSAKCAPADISSPLLPIICRFASRQF
jgi:hypothetical protein